MVLLVNCCKILNQLLIIQLNDLISYLFQLAFHFVIFYDGVRSRSPILPVEFRVFLINVKYVLYDF